MSETYSWKVLWEHAVFGMVYGRAKVPFLIRVFSTFRGETATWTNHTFNVMKDGLTIIESNPGRTRVSTWAKYNTEKQWGVLVGLVGFSNYDRQLWDLFSSQMLNKRYGYFSILKNVVDGFLSKIAGHDIRFARKFHIRKNPMSYNICAWLTAWGLKRIGLRTYDWVSQNFDLVEPETVNPDTIFDNVFNTFTPEPDANTSLKFIIIQEFGLRPSNLDQRVIDKIENDARYIQEHPEIYDVALM